MIHWNVGRVRLLVAFLLMLFWVGVGASLMFLTGCAELEISDEDTGIQDGRYNICKHEENQGSAICR